MKTAHVLLGVGVAGLVVAGVAYVRSQKDDEGPTGPNLPAKQPSGGATGPTGPVAATGPTGTTPASPTGPTGSPPPATPPQPPSPALLPMPGKITMMTEKTDGFGRLVSETFGAKFGTDGYRFDLTTGSPSLQQATERMKGNDYQKVIAESDVAMVVVFAGWQEVPGTPFSKPGDYPSPAELAAMMVDATHTFVGGTGRAILWVISPWAEQAMPKSAFQAVTDAGGYVMTANLDAVNWNDAAGRRAQAADMVANQIQKALRIGYP